MHQEPDKDPTNSKASLQDQVGNRMKTTYQWWDNLSTINADDPWWLGGLKIGARALGIIFLIALSPLIIAGLIFAFIAVA